MYPDSGDSPRPGGDAERVTVTLQHFQALEQRLEEARARARATCDEVRQGRSQREALHELALARLQAQLEFRAAIEQAKGILMAQRRCGPGEAFDVLRQESRRANVTVKVLAAQMVEQVSRKRPAAMGA